MSQFSQLSPVKVESNIEIAPLVYVLSFEHKYEFIPGQVVAVDLQPSTEARLYSIVSGRNQRLMQILFDVKQEGKLTPKLATVKAGDTIYVSRPGGQFIGDDDPAYWIASGTGIAPFVSMFRSGLGGNKVLLHGGRTLRSFYFQDDFIPVMEDKYVRCCTREHGEGVFSGRLTSYLQHQHNLPKNLKYFLCGSAEMVVEVRDILLSKQIPYDNILAETYF